MEIYYKVFYTKWTLINELMIKINKKAKTKKL